MSDPGLFNVRDYAATGGQLAVLGDGNAKPLSGFYGTLVAAQVDYPAAVALTDELDWAVLQKAITAAADATTNTSLATISTGSAPDVLIPKGAYLINRELRINLTSTTNGGSYLNIVGHGGPLIKQSDVTKRIFYWQSGANGNFDNVFTGLQLGGGTRQIEAWNGGNGPARLAFNDCDFIDSADYAVHIAGEPNAIVTFTRPRFIHCSKLLYTETLRTVIHDAWMVGVASQSPGNAAFIYNLGTLVLDNFDGSPDADCTAGTRWIDNYGQKVHIRDSRFGGEGASQGLGVVWQFTAPDSSNGFVNPTCVIIEGSDIAAGGTNSNGGMVNCRTNIPQLLILRGNSHFSHAPRVVNGGAINLATYFASFPAAYPSRYLFKMEIEPDEKWEDEIAADTFSFPNALRQYIAGVASSAKMIHTGGAPAKSFTEGTDTTPVNTEFYFVEIEVKTNMFVTGVSVLNGSAVSGNLKVGLFDGAGNLLIISPSTAQAGVNTYQRVPFNTGVGSGGYAIQVPATYYVGVFVDNSTARIRTHAAGDFGADKKTGQVYATGFTAITPPATFTAGRGPIASLY